MGNTLTACTSANTADRIPKNNAPTEKPSSNDTQGDVSTTAEGSTFVKNINIRKSLRAARKSVSKPFKKMKNRGKDGAQEGEDVATVAAVDVVVADAPKDEVNNEASATIEVETHTNEQDSKEVVVESKDVEASEAESSNVDSQLNSTTEECQVEAAVYEDRQDDDGKDDQVSQPEETDGSQTSTGNQEQLQPEEIKDGQETTIEIPEVNVTKVAEDAEDAGDAKEVIEQDSTDGEDKERGKRKAINEALFNKYDKDGSGLLKKSEIKRLLKNDLGLDREEASMMQLLIHEDESHELSLDEFQEFMETKDNVSLVTDGKSYKLLAEALKIFKQHDIDGSGKLTKDELGNLLQNDLGIPAEQADEVLVQYDTTGDQEMGFLEFVKFLPPTSHLIK